MEHFFQNIGEDWFNYCELYRSMVESAPDIAHFVEVGSWKGRSAAFLAVEINNSGKAIRLDCVDTWLGSEEHKEGGCAYEPHLMDGEDWLYNEFIRNVEPVKHIIHPVRGNSLIMANNYADESLDFVFLDAAHDYASVKLDLAAWYPKVKYGGFICGHDYSNNWPGVRQAVDEFFNFQDVSSINPSCGVIPDESWQHHKIKKGA